MKKLLLSAAILSFTALSIKAQNTTLGGGYLNGVSTFTTTGEANIQSVNIGLGGGSLPQNIGIGSGTLQNNTTGDKNIAIGIGAMQNNTTGGVVSGIDRGNIAIGDSALFTQTTGNSNIAIGDSALFLNNGTQNIAIGLRSMPKNTTGGNNTAVGHFTMDLNTTGSNNTAFGNSSMQWNTTGTENSVFGNQAMLSNTTGSNNCAFGWFSLGTFAKTGSTLIETQPSQNSAFGSGAASRCSTCYGNVIMGFDAAQQLKTGGNNTSLGYNSGIGLSAGLNNIFLGYNSGGTADISNRLFIANTSTNNPLIGGRIDTGMVVLNAAFTVNYPNIASVNTTATLSAAQVASGYIKTTSLSAVTMTMPAASSLIAGMGFNGTNSITAQQGTVFTFYIDNTGGANTVTLALNTGGSLSAIADIMTVDAGTVGEFRIVFSNQSSPSYVLGRIM